MAPGDMRSFRFGEFELDEARFELRRSGEALHLEPKVLSLIAFLVRSRDRAVTKEEIFDAVWPGVAVVEGALTRAVSLARKLLGDAPREPRFIRTVPRRGYRFVAPVDERRPGAAAPAPASAAPDPFVGREEECAQIEQAFRDARAGRGRLLLLAGEPGVGKTRLARESAQRLANAVLHWGESVEGSPAGPFGVWIPALRSLALSQEPAQLRASLGAEGAAYLADLVPEIRPYAGVRAQRPPLDARDARLQGLEAVASFVFRSAVAAPAVVVLDDLHAADPDSLALLRLLAQGVERSHAFVIATYRDVGAVWSAAFSEALAELSKAPHTRLALAGLSPAAVRQLLVEQGDLDIAGFSATLHERTGGNPLYLRELARQLQETARAAAAPGGVSPTLLELIGRRVAALPDECREVLSLAAVIGSELSPSLLREAAPEGAKVMEALARARNERLVEPAGEERLRFVHGLVREALLRELAPGLRARLHRRVASVLEARDSDPRTAPAAELAHHYREAILGGDTEKAVAWALVAGQRALAVLAVDEAASHFRAALDALEAFDRPDAARLAACASAAARAEWACARPDAARELARRAIAYAERAGGGRPLAEAAATYAGMQPVYARSDAVTHVLESTLSSLPREEVGVRARVLAQLSFDSFLRGDRALQEKRSREAVRLARASGDDEALQDALRRRSYALLHPTREREWLRVVEASIALAVRRESLPDEFDARLHRFEHAMQRGDDPALEAELKALARLAERLRTPGPAASLLRARAGLAIARGDLSQALDLAKSAAAIGRRSDTGLAHLLSLLQVGAILELEDRFGGIADEVRGASDERARASLLRVSVLSVHLHAGDFATARRRFRELVADDLADLPRDPSYAIALANLSIAAGELVEPAGGERLLAELAPYAGRNLTLLAHYHAGCASRYLGLVLGVLERWHEAEARFEEALEMDLRSGAATWACRVQIDHAQMLLRRRAPGDAARAQALLEQALRIARLRGLRRFERAVRELRA